MSNSVEIKEDGSLVEYTSTWEQATPKEMVAILQDRLFHTKRTQIIKRFNLKQDIKYWEGKVVNE